MSKWLIVQTPEFARWFSALDEGEKESVYRAVVILSEFGPDLGRPNVDSVKASRHSNMKELRVQHAGVPVRVFFAFGPDRKGVLLAGGRKRGQKDFYRRMLQLADRLFSRYLEGLNL